jgi:hypothetical protein
VAGPTSKPYTKAFACAGVAFIVTIIAALLTLGVPANADGASRLAGGLFAALAISALITGFFARRSSRVWSILRIVVTYVVVLFAIVVLWAIGKMGK